MALGDIRTYAAAAAAVALVGCGVMGNALKWVSREDNRRSDAHMWGTLGLVMAIVAAVLLGMARSKANCARADQKVDVAAMNRAFTVLENGLIALCVLQGAGLVWGMMNATSWGGGYGVTFFGMLGLFIAGVKAAVIAGDDRVQDCLDCDTTAACQAANPRL